MNKKLIEVDAQAFDDLMYWLDRCSEKGHLENCADLVDPWAIFDAKGWRVVEATQPAAGEPVAWMIDWPDEPELGHYFSEQPDEQPGGRSRPLFTVAPPAAAPVAAGEPVAFSTEHGALFWHGSPQDWKGKPVQLYLAPPAAAHGDGAATLVKALSILWEATNFLPRGGSLDGRVSAFLAQYAPEPVASAAAMRAQGDGGQA